MTARPATFEPQAPLAAWQLLLDSLPDPAWVAALADRCIVLSNAPARRWLEEDGARLAGRDTLDLLATPEDLAWWLGAVEAPPQPLQTESFCLDARGEMRPVSRSMAPLASAPGVPATHVLVTLRDLQREQAAEAERDTLLAELQATLEATADGILVTGPEGLVRAFNRRFAEIWGLPQHLLQGRDEGAIGDWMAQAVALSKDQPAYIDRLRELQAQPLATASDRLELHSGQVLERVTRPLLSRGRPQGRVWSFRDLTERIAAEERVEAASLHDTLTGLPNRAALADAVASAEAALRRDGEHYALLVLDLDRFRHINDSLGHETGNRVLQEVARRIEDTLRQGDVLARIGGDQFAVLMNRSNGDAAEAAARRILNVVSEPCSLDGAQFTLTCSIGVALAPAHGHRMDDLVRHAEAAMRRVKDGGRGSYRLHQQRTEVDRRQHMRLEHAMRQALVSGRFRLVYQPQVDLVTGQLVGAEALLRWRDPELGDIPPGRFIPVAEESGFIIALGDWVLSQAVRQASLWQARGWAVPVAVNVSALQFQQAQFIDRVGQVLAVSGLPPHLLELELTESILVHDAEEAMGRLQALARLGVTMSIDDFGTGYSSLAYLKRFPIGKLKIDRGFIMGLPADDSDSAIVRAILQMARALGKRVIAEGVETEAQRAFLQSAGCDEFQGFLYAPPLDVLSFETCWAQGQPPAAVSDDRPPLPAPDRRSPPRGVRGVPGGAGTPPQGPRPPPHSGKGRIRLVKP